MHRQLLALVAVPGLLMAAPTVADEENEDYGVTLPAPLEQRLVAIDVQTGNLANRGNGLAVLYDETFTIDQAPWLRLKFGELELSGDVMRGNGSFLRITSLQDGGVQFLDAVSIEQWGRSSAYFNGDSVRVELLSYPRTGRNHLEILFAWVGVEPQGGEEDTICGSVDDRVLSDDPRAGRVVPVGCSVNIIDDFNRCFITAGHCSGSGLQVVEFNVPLSSGSGSLNHPGPEDQYAVDPVSVQAASGGVGNDWGYFGCFPNSNTGLTPSEAQGDFFIRAPVAPPVTGQDIRITGYGSDSTPPQHNQVQQTHAGPYMEHSGTRLEYRTDTTGGNSGTAVQDDSTGLVIGIHTHGGCNSTGGANSGTAIQHPGLQNAFANPLGVCAPGISFLYPSGRPDFITPGGGVAFVVEVQGQNGGDPQPETGTLFFDRGNGFESVLMNELAPNVYEAAFPAIDCGTLVSYYISAESTTGAVVTDPGSAPNSAYEVITASTIDVVVSDDFETNMGWTVQNTAVEDGPWERGVPAGGGDRGDPATDLDGSGRCWVTGLGDGDNDLDGGPTRLLSPTFDLTAHPDATVRYARWFMNDDNDNDRLTVEISDDNGSTWTLVESVGDTPTGWVEVEFTVADFVTPSSQVRFRFSASDQPNNSVTEAGLDAFRIRVVSCDTTELVDFDVRFGVLEAGGLAQLEASDDDRVRVQSVFGFSGQEPNVTETDFIFEAQNTAAVMFDYSIETSVDNPGGVMRTRAFNYSTSQYQNLTQFNIGVAEQVYSQTGVDATDRIRASDGQMRLNARQVVVATFAASGFKSFFDFVDINVN